MNRHLLLPALLFFTPPALHAQARPLAQDYSIVFHNPDRERYVEGPGLARLDDGRLVAVVPVVPREEWSAERRATQSVTHILRSGDGGKTWSKPVTLFEGHFWNCPARRTSTTPITPPSSREKLPQPRTQTHAGA